MLSIGLALFEQNEETIKSADTFDRAYQAFASVTDRAFNPDQLIQVAYNKFKFPKRDIDQLRADLRAENRAKDKDHIRSRTECACFNCNRFSNNMRVLT
jgi:hypothetical protein